MTLPTVSVVISTYNRAENIRRVVSPLLGDPAATEILLVVNGSTDESWEVATELGARDDRIHPYYLDPNRGLLGAHIFGVERSRSEVVLFLDDDVEPESGVVTGHARWHAEDEGLVVVGRLRSVLPEVRRPGDFPAFVYAKEYAENVELWQRHPDRLLESLWMGNTSFRREDLLRVGHRSPKTPLYSGEWLYHLDRELGIRCQKAGLRGVYDPGLEVAHVHSRSLESWSRTALQQGAELYALHEIHRDLLGPLDLRGFEERVPPPFHWLVRASGVPGLREALVSTLGALTRAFGRAHLWGLETRAAKLLRRIEFREGAVREAQAREKLPLGRRSATPKKADTGCNRRMTAR